MLSHCKLITILDFFTALHVVAGPMTAGASCSLGDKTLAQFVVDSDHIAYTPFLSASSHLFLREDAALVYNWPLSSPASEMFEMLF